jgi:hypothetical protein
MRSRPCLAEHHDVPTAIGSLDRDLTKHADRDRVVSAELVERSRHVITST